MTGAVFLDRHVDAAAVRAEVRDHVHVDFGMLGVDAVEHFLRQNAHFGPAYGTVVVFDLGAGDLGIFFRGPVGAVPVVGEGDGLGRAVVAALGAQAAGVAPHRDLEAAAVLEFRDVDGSGGADVDARAAAHAQRRVDFDPPAQAVRGICFSEGEGVGHRALLEVVPKDFEEFHISPPSFPARWRRLRARLP